VLNILILFACSAWAQKLEFPPVINTVPSVETAFLALLHNMAYLSEKSILVDHIKYENTSNRYIEYIDFVLNNMTYDNINNYFTQIALSAERIDYQNLSRKQQADFEYFLNTAIVDSWTFGTGKIELVNTPTINAEIPDEALNEFDAQIAQEQKNIEEYERQLSALPTLQSIQKTIDDAVREYRTLQNSTPRTAEAVREKTNRLTELKDIEMNARRQYREISNQSSTLTSRISSANSRINNMEWQKIDEKARIQKEVEQNYITNLHDQINNFSVWQDFFNKKNEVVKDYLLGIDIKGHLEKIIHNEIPQRQENEYRVKFNAFCAGWGI
jgi:hypothetical protein